MQKMWLSKFNLNIKGEIVGERLTDNKQKHCTKSKIQIRKTILSIPHSTKSSLKQNEILIFWRSEEIHRLATSHVYLQHCSSS
jgi:hypothetical protein